MAWGDTWGSSPSSYHRELAEAFFAGKPRGTAAKACVRCHDTYSSYELQGRDIARFSAPEQVAEAIARKLTGDDEIDVYPEMVFRCARNDKMEMRHLKALGVEAEWQGGKLPFLAFGVDVMDSEWRTIEQVKAMPKWVPKSKEARVQPQRERFVNMTMPLFS